MNKEEQTRCSMKFKGEECRGTIWRDHRLNRIELAEEHRKYTCDKCNTSWKFFPEPEIR